MLKLIGKKNISTNQYPYSLVVCCYLTRLTRSAHDIVILKVFKIAKLVEELLANRQLALIDTTDVIFEQIMVA